MKKSVSIIIPALNEEDTLSELFERLKDISDCEVILVDGGSTDSTLLLAEKAGCITVSSPPGRGRQMNFGAELATGGIVLFLHADTLLPANFLQLVQKTMRQPGIVAGAFSLAIKGKSMSKRLAIITWFANIRSRYLHLPYGDQAIFTQRSTFLEAGGFPDIEIMEDFVFIKSLKKIGGITLLAETVTTSDRRWRNMGILRTTIINQIVVCGFFLGIKPVKLASFYQRLRGITPKR